MVPHGTKGTGPRFIMRPVYFEVPVQEQREHSFTLVLMRHLLHVLCTRYAGVAHHQALQTSRRGWADSKAVHGMECNGARSLYWRSLSAGAAACGVPYCQYREVCSPTRPNANKPTNYQQRTNNPGSCVRVVYIAGDTLRHQPMGAGHMTAPVMWAYGIPCPALVIYIYIAGDTLRHQPMEAGHMTVLQLRGLMGFRVLQWCHPMLASTMRASCRTRIITLYGTRKWIQAHAQGVAQVGSCLMGRNVD